MWPDTRLLDLFGIELPIVQAPMANATGVEMAVAVAKAGGLGSLPCAMLGSDKIRAGVTEFRAQSNKPFNLNFFCHAAPAEDVAREQAWLTRLAPYYTALGATPPSLPLKAGLQPFGEEACALVEELRPAIVSFHFGLPAPALLQRVKSAGCKILSSATSVKEAVWLAERGVDAVIAQGAEAGGHRGMFLETDVATPDRHLRARAAGRRRGEGSGHRRRRHCRCPRCRRSLRARRFRRADRHRLSSLPRGAYLRAASRGTEEARARHRHHQCADRAPGARDSQPVHRRARAGQCGSPCLPARHSSSDPAEDDCREARLRRLLVLLVRRGAARSAAT